MAKNQINFSDATETDLVTITKIGLLNGIDVSNNEKKVALACKIAANMIKFSNEETLENLTNLKKTI
jgi:hypothetical protein